MLLNRNFIVLNIIEGTFIISEFEKKMKSSLGKFEKVNIDLLDLGMYLIKYSWIDKLKVSEKYSKPAFNEVNAIFFEDKKRIAIFSNSESNVTYFCNKVLKRVRINSLQIAYFSMFKEAVLSNTLNDKIIAYELRNPTLSLQENNFKKYSGDLLNLDHLINVLEKNEEDIVSITLKNESSYSNKNIIYYIDSCSVVSLPDNIKKDDFYLASKQLSEKDSI